MALQVMQTLVLYLYIMYENHISTQVYMKAWVMMVIATHICIAFLSVCHVCLLCWSHWIQWDDIWHPGLDSGW